MEVASRALKGSPQKVRIVEQACEAKLGLKLAQGRKSIDIHPLTVTIKNANIIAENFALHSSLR